MANALTVPHKSLIFGFPSGLSRAESTTDQLLPTLPENCSPSGLESVQLLIGHASTGLVPVWSENLTTNSSDKPHPYFPRNRLRRFRGKRDVGGLLSSRQISSPSGTSPEEDLYDKTQPYQTIKLYVLLVPAEATTLGYPIMASVRDKPERKREHL